MPMPDRTVRIVTPLLLAALAIAQDPAPTPPKTAPGPEVVGQLATGAPAAARTGHVALSWPEDQDAPIAVVGSRTLTLRNLVEHLDSRHHPGFKQALATRPEIQRMLDSDLMAPWVRHFADLEALRQALGDQQPDPKALEAAQSESLRQSFQGYLDRYVESRKQAGRPTEMSQQRINTMLSDYQLQNGLAAELQGMLDLLEPDDYPRGVLQEFFNQNARVFGGQVTIAHILVQHRDGGRGLLLDAEGLARANDRLADIKARLRPDGSNFEEIAQLYSDDTRTAKDGGRLVGVHRYDDRLPAALCRAAWQLRDGEVSPDVIETPYGWHLVKRLEFTQQVFILFTDDAIPTIRQVMRRAMQEKRLFEAREKAALRLLL